jgi:hypothetical protein
MDRKFEPVMRGGQSAQAKAASPFDAPVFGRGEIAVDRNQVLRNTYWLLALSLLPTIGGAYLGSQLNLFGDVEYRWISFYAKNARPLGIDWEDSSTKWIADQIPHQCPSDAVYGFGRTD